MALAVAACKNQSHILQLAAMAQHDLAQHLDSDQSNSFNASLPACAGSSSVSNTRNCPNSPVTWPTGSGQVSSFSVVDSKLGTALGLDTNSAPAAQAGAAAGVPSSPLAVNGLANGLNNTPGTQNGQGNGQGSVGAGNGNQNGNNNAGSLNGNGNGIGNTGNGNGVGNGNGNTNPQG
jgi:hypothetical protein